MQHGPGLDSTKEKYVIKRDKYTDLDLAGYILTIIEIQSCHTEKDKTGLPKRIGYQWIKQKY